MKSRLVESTFRIDQETIELDGHQYDIGDIILSCNNQLSLILDTNPIEDRQILYQHYGNWMCMTDDNTVMQVMDEELLEFLTELERTIPPNCY